MAAGPGHAGDDGKQDHASNDIVKAHNYTSRKAQALIFWGLFTASLGPDPGLGGVGHRSDTRPGPSLFVFRAAHGIAAGF